MIGHCLVVARGGGVASTVGVDHRPLPGGGGGGGVSSTVEVGHRPLPGGGGGGGVSSTVEVDHRPLPGGGGGGWRVIRVGRPAASASCPDGVPGPTDAERSDAQ